MAGLLGILCYVITISTASIIVSWPTPLLATDKPVHLAVLTLICTSALLLFLAKRSQSTTRSDRDRLGNYASVPLQDLDDGASKIVQEKQRIHNYALSSPALLFVIAGAAVALVLRIEVHRRLLFASECVHTNVEVWLPFLVAVYDALRFQQRENLEAVDDNDALDSSVYHDLAQSLKRKLLSSPWRYVPTAFLLSWGCHLVAGLWSSSQSSYICPLISSDFVIIPRLQCVALLLDAAVASAALELALGGMLPSSPLLSLPISWAVVTTLSAGTWTGISVLIYHLEPENRAWLLMQHDSPRSTALAYLLLQALLLSTLCVSILYSVVYTGLLRVSMALTALVVVIPGIRFIWTVRKPYPPVSSTNLTWSFVVIYVAWSLYNRTQRAMHPSEQKPSTIRRLLIFSILLLVLWPGLFKSNTVHYHPIDLLMYDAQNKHMNYLNLASQSRNLASAVRIYEERYQDTPPPGFDVWFEFARNSSVLVTDEFNQIYNDLLPFRSIAPKALRQYTWDMVSNPWNEISGITIRGGKAAVQENVLPTHRWMLEGVVHIIDSFSQHLPDMDLAFNLNDESRVALRYYDRERLEDNAQNHGFRGTSSFSANRAEGWNGIPEQPITDTVFENWSFLNTFHEWAGLGCSPSSAAAKKDAPSSKSQLCLHCAAEHSLGQFVANWSVAADPCHQSDLANLHGFYLSPAAFKGTHELMPVFSQSKARGFNDILYPSAWNYMDKVVYAPTNTSTDDRAAYPDSSFSDKENTLFWRGATSEGVSDGHGAWRGMTRQRMVHLANNLTTSQHDRVTMLLPDQRHSAKYTYTTLAGDSLRRLGLQTNVRLVDGIARCGGRDCDEQEVEFGLVGPQNFQSHWQYKYLIDMDGAGFSGRFLPFLQSGSLPFKVALFREWYDSRLMPWLHFVPIDIRLHGLWSTLAYFSGIHGIDSSGRNWDWTGHQREAELIAQSGREWSQKVLRKEDMEVYFFRLLLEWGRLTDDRRDDLGYAVT